MPTILFRVTLIFSSSNCNVIDGLLGDNSKIPLSNADMFIETFIMTSFYIPLTDDKSID